MKIGLKILSFIMVFVGIWYYRKIHSDTLYCNIYRKYNALSFNGVVVKKFLDPKDHSFPYLYIADTLNRESIIKLNLFYDKSGLFQNVNLNNRLIKFPKNPWVYKVENHKMIKFKYLNFNCPNSCGSCPHDPPL